MAAIRNGAASENPDMILSAEKAGMASSICWEAAFTAFKSIIPEVQPMKVPIIIAKSPTGIRKGNFTFPNHPSNMMINETRPIYVRSKVCIAGVITINVNDTPAREPSIAALGKILLTVGPIRDPDNSIIPSINPQANPANQARYGSPVFQRSEEHTSELQSRG